jgi:ubiquinone/menaquinone biosynthesis C-methylase UbiE
MPYILKQANNLSNSIGRYYNADMTVRIDPEGTEKKVLLDFAGDLTGKRVLEVGCGNGRLTWHYAHLPAHTIGLDPNPDRIAQARQGLPAHLHDRVEFHVSSLQEYQPPHSFDLIIFSWSL